ncbi:MAG TPA: hypothetical protein VGJ30_17885 [Candidatus Angelobacter sp.]|jgi:hypothetical protein
MSSPRQGATTKPVRIPAAIAAVIGLIVGAVSLLVFVFDLLVTPEVGALIVSFVVCGMGLTGGFMVLRRLAPRREPMSLFGGPDGVPVQSAMPTELCMQRNGCPPEVITNARPVHSNAQITPVMKSHGSESIATYKTHDSAGALVLLTAIGVSLVLGGRLDGGWHFLSLAVPAGGAVALVLYWIRSRQDASISAYKIPVAGGIIGAAALAGVSLVMMRFHFLRDFLLLAAGAGCAVALVLNWRRRREESSSGSFL